MKLSEMFAGLSRNAQDLEKRMGEWEADLTKRGEAWLESGKQWLADAQKRDDEMAAQMKGYVDRASDSVKAQWAKGQQAWDAEIAQIRARTDQMRKDAVAMNAKDRAEWSEAYAAQMLGFAQKVQDEAGKAVAAAAEARAASDKAAKA